MVNMAEVVDLERMSKVVKRGVLVHNGTLADLQVADCFVPIERCNRLT